MGLFSWIRERRERSDEETIEAANEMDDETAEEREYMHGDINAMTADQHALRRVGGSNDMGDIERMNDSF